MCLQLVDKSGRKVTHKGETYQNAVAKYATDKHLQKAHADMIVYKGLDEDKGRYLSPHQAFEYEIGAEYYQTNQEFTFDTNWYNEIRIHQGLHVATTKKRARKHGKTIGVFIIPKGSTYFVGSNDELVCDRYIFKKAIKSREC